MWETGLLGEDAWCQVLSRDPKVVRCNAIWKDGAHMVVAIAHEYGHALLDAHHKDKSKTWLGNSLHEFFADVCAVLYTKNPAAVRFYDDTTDTPEDLLKSPSDIWSAKTIGRDFRNTVDLETWAPHDVDVNLAPARAYVGKHFLPLATDPESTAHIAKIIFNVVVTEMQYLQIEPTPSWTFSKPEANKRLIQQLEAAHRDRQK